MEELSRLDNTMKTFKEVTLNKHQEVLTDLDDNEIPRETRLRTFLHVFLGKNFF